MSELDPECLYRKLTPKERDYIRAVRMLTSFQETGTILDALTRNRNDCARPQKILCNRQRMTV